jgi:hypothetical protein
MDVSSVLAQMGTLGGVGLGAWLSGRFQRNLIRLNRRDELRREMRLTCARSLAAQRQFRRYLQTSDAVTVAKVPVVERPDKPTSLARGTERQAEIYEQALADFEVLVDDQAVLDAHATMRASLFEVVRARADYPPGGVPESVVNAAADAERAFAQQVRKTYPG